MIKQTFFQLKKLDCGRKRFYKQRISDYPLSMADQFLVPCTPVMDQESEQQRKSCRTLSLIPRSHSLYEKKPFGEPSQISWGSTCFCDSVTQKTFTANPLKKVWILEWR